MELFICCKCTRNAIDLYVDFVSSDKMFFNLAKIFLKILNLKKRKHLKTEQINVSALKKQTSNRDAK